MTNQELILILGIGLAATALALVIPPFPNRPTWLNMLLGIAGVVLGLLAVLMVAVD